MKPHLPASTTATDMTHLQGDSLPAHLPTKHHMHQQDSGAHQSPEMNQASSSSSHHLIQGSSLLWKLPWISQVSGGEGQQGQVKGQG